MKYPVRVEPDNNNEGWFRVLDADGNRVANGIDEADANTIRDAMNKCAPPPDPATFPLADVKPTDCWAWTGKYKFFQACSNQSAAESVAVHEQVRPIRGRFIPDNATAEQVYAEIARLLNLLEPTIDSPSVNGNADFHTIPVEYEANEARIRLAWDGPHVEGIVDALRACADGHLEDQDHDWPAMVSDHAADLNADARIREAKEDRG